MEKWTLEHDGDGLEKQYHAQLNQKLSAYEPIWANFIGNDGTNHLVDIPEFPENKKKYRKSFSEHHYTIAESVLCLEQVIVDFETLEAQYPSTHLLAIQNLLMAFHGHMGRIINNVEQVIYNFCRINDRISEDHDIEQISKERIVKSLTEDLASYYYLRHIAVHGKKIPIGVNKKGEAVIPKLKTEKDSADGWDKFMNWDDVDKVAVLHEYFSDISTDLPLAVNNILHSIHNDLFQYKKNYGLVMPLPGQAKKERGKYEQGSMKSLTHSEGRSGYFGYPLISDDPQSLNTSGSTGL